MSYRLDLSKVSRRKLAAFCEYNYLLSQAIMEMNNAFILRLQAEPLMTGELLADHVNECSAAINRLIATSDAEIAKIVGAENVKLN